MALVFLLPMLCWHRFFQDKRWGITLAFPAIWVLNEWLRSWIFTGFPWLFIGYSQTETFIGNWAPVAGVYGISFLLALLAATIFDCIQQRRCTITFLLSVSLLCAGSALLGTVQWTHAITGSQQDFALIQGNVPQQLKWKPEQREAIRALYWDASKPLLKKLSGNLARSGHSRTVHTRSSIFSTHQAVNKKQRWCTDYRRTYFAL